MSVLQVAMKGNVVDAEALTEIPEVKQKFVSLYNATSKTQNGEMIYAAEKQHFANLVSTKSLESCTIQSLYIAFLNAAINGLSFDPNAKHVYLMKDFYNKTNAAVLVVTAQGEAALRIQRNILKGYDKPVLVYDCDEYSVGYRNGEQVVNYSPAIPRTEGAKEVGGFIKIYTHDRPNGYFMVYSREEISKWRKYSKSWNDDQTNPNKPDFKKSPWTTDPHAQILTKIIKHSIKKLPVVAPLGQGIKLEDEQQDFTIDYSLEGEAIDTETGEITATVEETVETVEAETVEETQTPPPDDDMF